MYAAGVVYGDTYNKGKHWCVRIPLKVRHCLRRTDQDRVLVSLGAVKIIILCMRVVRRDCDIRNFSHKLAARQAPWLQPVLGFLPV